MKSPTHLLLLLALSTTQAKESNNRDLKMTQAQRFASSKPQLIPVRDVVKAKGLNGFNNKLTLALGGFDKSASGREPIRTVIVKKKKDAAADSIGGTTTTGLRKKQDMNTKKQNDDTLSTKLSQSLTQALNNKSGNGNSSSSGTAQKVEKGDKMKPKASALPQGL